MPVSMQPDTYMKSQQTRLSNLLKKQKCQELEAPDTKQVARLTKVLGGRQVSSDPVCSETVDRGL
jgi:hypothetical protein